MGNCLPFFFIPMANKLLFEVIENKSVETLLLNNLTVPETPLQYPVWRIKYPGAVDYKSVVLTDNPAQNITAADLDIICESCTVNPLPDGIYEVVLQETVGAVVNTCSKFHLRANLFSESYSKLLLKIEYSEYTKTEDEAIQNICLDIDMLLQSAKAHAEEGNIQKAEELFYKAVKKLNRISKSLTDC